MRSSAGSLKRNALDLSLDDEDEDEYGYTKCKYFFICRYRGMSLTDPRCKMRFQCFRVRKYQEIRLFLHLNSQVEFRWH